MITVSDVKSICNGSCVDIGSFEFAADDDEMNYKLYDDSYVISINGADYRARHCRVSKYPFNRVWPGHQRDFSQSEDAAFISVYADEDVTIRVRGGAEFKSPVVRPLSRGVEVGTDNGEVVFCLKEYGQYVFEHTDAHNALHIFYEKRKEYDAAQSADYYFGEGLHFPGVISLKSNESVYIDKNAVVFGSVYADGAENIRIFGGGTIDNTNEERFVGNCYEPYVKGAVKLYNCKNVKIEDVILTNSSTWVLSVFDCDDISIDNVKIVGQWRYNSDGIDIVNTSNVTIKNSFVRAFDDVITIKAIYDYDKPVENITVDNCVLWCDWGKTCEVGIETDAPEYRNITFKNCELIHNMHVALDVHGGCDCDIHDITFENIGVEYQLYTDFPKLQERNADIYEAEDGVFLPELINILNSPYSVRKKGMSGLERKTCKNLARIHGIRFKNVNVYLPNESLTPPIAVKSDSPSVIFHDIEIDGIYINGSRQSDLSKFGLERENAEDIIFS